MNTQDMKALQRRAEKGDAGTRLGKMFDHEIFEVFNFQNIPTDRECFLMDERYMSAYQENVLRVYVGGDNKAVGLINRVVCNSIREDSLELSWYVNTFDRFHSIPVILPKDKLVVCVECYEMGERPHFFVKRDWLEDLLMQTHSVFCMVDAIDFKKLMENGNLSKESLAVLRDKIDELGKEYPQIVFISFADSILLKSNWTVGYHAKWLKSAWLRRGWRWLRTMRHHSKRMKSAYNPEIFIEIVSKLADIYRSVLGLDIYAVLTQGGNGYYGNALLHMSNAGNHISLNSLGIPFADLQFIEFAAKRAIKQGKHGRAQLYMDRGFYISLKFKDQFKYNKQQCYAYESKMKSVSNVYYPNDIKTIENALCN